MFAVHHLYFSASTAAKAERYLSMAAWACGVKSSPMWQASDTSRQCVRSCREDQHWLEQTRLDEAPSHHEWVANLDISTATAAF